MKKVSVCVPCYNEVGNVRDMAETLTGIMQGLPYEYEIIFTDNCSTDGTKDILRELASKDTHIKVLMNSRNYGTDGRSDRNTGRYITGDVMLTIPCDFQEPPELIPEFIKYWEEGYQVVCGQKTSSEEGKIKYACRHLYYRIIQALSNVPQNQHKTGIMLIDRDILEKFIKTDYDFQLRFAIADMGCKVKLIPYKQRKRKSGRSSYNIWRYLNYAINSLVTTSVAPIRIMTVAGLCFSFFSFAIGLIYLIWKLVWWQNFQMGTAPILIGMFFLGSVQIFILGIIGEYVGEILNRVSKKPDVVTTEEINFDSQAELKRTGETAV